MTSQSSSSDNNDTEDGALSARDTTRLNGRVSHGEVPVWVSKSGRVRPRRLPGPILASGAPVGLAGYSANRQEAAFVQTYMIAERIGAGDRIFDFGERRWEEELTTLLSDKEWMSNNVWGGVCAAEGAFKGRDGIGTCSKEAVTRMQRWFNTANQSVDLRRGFSPKGSIYDQTEHRPFPEMDDTFWWDKIYDDMGAPTNIADKYWRTTALTTIVRERTFDVGRFIRFGWYALPGAVAALGSIGNERVNGYLEPSETLKGLTRYSFGCPALSPLGFGGKGNSSGAVYDWLDWVEMEPPWKEIRWNVHHKRKLIKRFNYLKQEYETMNLSRLTGPTRKKIEPFLEQAKAMTERERSQHIASLGDGVADFAKNVGQMGMDLIEAYRLAYPTRSGITNTAANQASRLMKDSRVVLAVAIYAVTSTAVLYQKEVRMGELVSRTYEVFQASMDVNNTKVALDAIKFLAELSGHVQSGKGGAGSKGNVNVQVNTSGSSAPSVVLSSSDEGEDRGRLAASGGDVPLLVSPRKQKAKDMINRLVSVLDTKSSEMEWVNTNSLSFVDAEEVEEEGEEDNNQG